MSSHESSHTAAGIPLKALVAELRGRCETIARLQGGSTYFHEEVGIFRAFAKEHGLMLQTALNELNWRASSFGKGGHASSLSRQTGVSPVFFISLDSFCEKVHFFLGPKSQNVERGSIKRAPNDEGNEHQVWFQQDSQTYLKATWPDFFELLVIHRLHQEHKASPIAYLEHWHLHNEVFGDQVVFLGALASDAGQRLLIRQLSQHLSLYPMKKSNHGLHEFSRIRKHSPRSPIRAHP